MSQSLEDAIQCTETTSCVVACLFVISMKIVSRIASFVPFAMRYVWSDAEIVDGENVSCGNAAAAATLTAPPEFITQLKCSRLLMSCVQALFVAK